VRLAFLIVAFAAAGAASSQAPPPLRLLHSPARPEPGAFVRLTLDRLPPADADARLTGELAGEPLHFVRADSGRWRAIGAIPINAARRVVATAVVTRAGRTDTIRATVVVPPIELPTAEPLRVDSSFTALDSATSARVNDENARARALGTRSHDTPRLWREPFVRPRATAITGRFGGGRMFNGRVTSRHLGVDFQGALGDTIRASNRGVVALVDTFFLAGVVVYVDHGAGVVTGYFHVSEALVQAGDTVARAQPIARVGASGRVTGAHLHWSARYGALTANPLDLVALRGY